MANILDGKSLATKVKEEVKQTVSTFRQQPGLAVIVVGNDPASRIYVNGKKRDCSECGIASREYHLPEDVSMETLLALIEQLNRDDEMDGVLCQLPVPKHLDEEQILLAIDRTKDVDCFHPFNVGQMLIGNGTFLPCTPAGVMRMLEDAGIPVEGKKCVVVGRSNIVGKPMGILLLQQNGTVTYCHSRTPDLAAVTREADILVSAVGKVNLITADMVKEGAVVIDVAMNRNAEGKLCGDVDFPAVSEKASYITPVPGGCGPMTRAMLMVNTMSAARLHGKE